MKNYNTLFFDLDHTLWDFESNSYATLDFIYKKYALSEIGIDSFQTFYETYKMHNEKLWDRYRKGFIKREALKWKRMWLTLLDFKIANEPLAKEMAHDFITLLPEQTQLFPKTIEVLEYCKQKGYDLNLITNGFEDTQWKKLKASGLTDYFTHVITSESTNSVKPNAAIFEFAVDAAQTTISQSLMIGDNYEVDILGAKNIGMDQVYFNPEKLPHSYQPTYEIAHLEDLLNIV